MPFSIKSVLCQMLEEICPLSARMVVNQVSLKMENERIHKLLEDLNRLIKEENK